MTRHQLPAALYAPLRVVLYENAAGGATFEYDRPSTLFGQFGDEQVAAVGRELDVELERALRRAAAISAEAAAAATLLRILGLTAA